MIAIAPHDIVAPDGKPLLKHFSANIEEREKVAFTGPNGSGKTTLLRQIAGLESRRCRVSISVSHRRISYLPTRPLDLLLPWATFSDNVKMFGSAANRPVESIRADFRTYSSQIGIDVAAFWDKVVFKMSSGQQAMAAIFCALIQSPTLLIADEVFSTLAERPRLNVARMLKVANLTLVCASHDSDFIDVVGARRISLDQFIA